MSFFKSGKQPKAYMFFGIAVGALTPIIGRYNPKLFAAIMVICMSVLLATLVAYVISTWVVKRGKFNERVLKVLFWSNVVAWVIPDLGFLIGALTNQINFHNHGNDRRKYMLLGSIGFMLSLLHFAAKLAHIIKW